MNKKTILVAADFSEAAKSALDFAIVLARQLQADLLVIHAYSLPFSFVPDNADAESDGEQDFLNHISEKLRLLCARIDAAGDLQYTCRAVEGPVVETVVKEAAACEASLVVIGNKGVRDMFAHFLGSSVSGIIEKSSCPVITVPAVFKWTRPIFRITYATAFQRTDSAKLAALAALARSMNSELCILHVSGSEDELERDTELLNSLAKRVEKETGYGPIGYELLNGDDPAGELSRYVGNGGTGMLVLSTGYRTWLGHLMNSSVTRVLALRSAVPVMVFHHRKREEINIY